MRSPSIARVARSDAMRHAPIPAAHTKHASAATAESLRGASGAVGRPLQAYPLSKKRSIRERARGLGRLTTGGREGKPQPPRGLDPYIKKSDHFFPTKPTAFRLN
jgi:hypothetical protein